MARTRMALSQWGKRLRDDGDKSSSKQFAQLAISSVGFVVRLQDQRSMAILFRIQLAASRTGFFTNHSDLQVRTDWPPPRFGDNSIPERKVPVAPNGLPDVR